MQKAGGVPLVVDGILKLVAWRTCGGSFAWGFERPEDRGPIINLEERWRIERGIEMQIDVDEDRLVKWHHDGVTLKVTLKLLHFEDNI